MATTTTTHVAPPSAVHAPVTASSSSSSSTAAAAAVIQPVAAASSFNSSRPGGGTFTDVKASGVRKVIASRLTESKAGTPHFYATMDCKLDAVLLLRAKLKDVGIAVSVNDVVIAAAARALRAVPEANSFFDVKSGLVRKNATVDVSVAVATEGGLITPIVKGADALGLAGINSKVKDLAGRARAGKLQPAEYQGGSFTISNLGMFAAINEFSAVINPPQACILAVGKGEARVLLPRLGEAGDVPSAVPFISQVMSVQLSADARVVDAAIAGQFLFAFRTFVEDPTLIAAV